MRDVLYDSQGDLTVEITRSQLEAWVGHKLTDDQVYALDECIPDSSIPEAIDTIVHEAMGFDGKLSGDPRRCTGPAGHEGDAG